MGMLVAYRGEKFMNMFIKFPGFESPAFFTTMHPAFTPRAHGRVGNSGSHNC